MLESATSRLRRVIAWMMQQRSPQLPAPDLVKAGVALFAFGGLLCALTYLVGRHEGARPGALAGLVVVTLLAAPALWMVRRRMGPNQTHAATAIGTVLIAASVFAGGRSGIAFAFWYVPVAVYVFHVFSHRAALAHAGLMAAALGLVLAVGSPGAPTLPPGDAFALWLVLCSVVLMTGVLSDLLVSRLRLLAENASDVVVRMRPDGHCTYVSPSALGILDRPSSDFIGRHLGSLFHPSDRGRLEEVFSNIRRGGGPATFTHRLRTRTGFDRWFETVARPVNDPLGRLLEIHATSRDVTERWRAEEELRHSREQLAVVVGNAPVVLFAIDRHGVITLAEGKGLDAIGLGPGEAVGKPLAEIYWNEPELLKHLERALAGESSTVEIEPAALRLALEIRFNPIRSAAGVVTGVIAVATDISERRRAEAARRESEAKTRFLARMSHELRTPLNSVLGFAELLENTADPLSERQTRYVRHIRSSGQHLLDIINDLLDLARAASEEIVIELEDLDLDSVIRDAVSTLSPQAEAKRLVLEVLSDRGIEVRTDRKRLLQVLLNLISNAIKFTPTEGKISVGCRAARGEALVWVSDTGVGIDPADLDRIFDEFVQLGTGDGRREGTGLGLPVSRRLIELLGGTISVESRVGEGSVFTVSVPLSGSLGPYSAGHRTPRRASSARARQGAKAS